MNAGLTSAWSGDSFWTTQAILAIGFALSFNAMVGAIVLEVFNTGALSRPIDVLTFAGYFSNRASARRRRRAPRSCSISSRCGEQFHSNMLGLGVQLGLGSTDQRLLGLSAALASRTVGGSNAAARAGEIIGLQIRQQAFTLAITDAFTLVAWASVGCLVVIACMARVPVQYQQIVAAPAPSV